jgi:hypothetical protein
MSTLAAVCDDAGAVDGVEVAVGLSDVVGPDGAASGMEMANLEHVYARFSTLNNNRKMEQWHSEDSLTLFKYNINVPDA